MTKNIFKAKKIAIIGCSGSGKTTLANELGRRLMLPVYHLDRYFWLPGWVERDYDQFLKLHAQLCARDEWIMDGNQVRTIPHRVVTADVVIFLDMPRRICLWRTFKRWWQGQFKRRADLAEGCNDRLTFKFFWYVWCYQKKYRPRVIAALEQADRNASVIIMRSAGEVAEFLTR